MHTCIIPGHLALGAWIPGVYKLSIFWCWDLTWGPHNRAIHNRATSPSHHSSSHSFTCHYLWPLLYFNQPLPTKLISHNRLQGPDLWVCLNFLIHEPSPSCRSTNITMSTINKYFSVITLNINGFNYPIQRHSPIEWVKKQNPSIVYNIS